VVATTIGYLVLNQTTDVRRSKDDTEPRPDGTHRHLWASFAEREPNISSQLGVAERSALSEASAETQRTEIF
jgi:hypothetical protein